MSNSKVDIKDEAVMSSSANTASANDVKRRKGNTWILLAMTAGLSYGLGNVAYGKNCSQLGVWGSGMTGPITLFVIVAYRLFQACQLKRKTGRFVDKSNSNFWSVQEPVLTTEQDCESLNDDYQTAASTTPADPPQYMFRWANLRQAALY